MDDLEFRRRILSDPNDNSPDMATARNSSVNNRKLADELKQLDVQIDNILKVDVPDDLADRILFHQSGQSHDKPNKARFHLAIAASVAFVFGILLGQFNPQRLLPAEVTGMGQIALQHIHNEASFIEGVNESVSLRQVNAKLQPFGTNLTDLPGHVYYVNHCGFGDQSALHMVMETEKGKVTVFVVPETSTTTLHFNDSRMEGVVLPLQHTSLIVVGEKGQDITPIANTIKSEMRWKI
ncbi:DUF3379 domain-containing protein [Photobacterium sp.]|uniref:DUF3379 domain-containing protein n=1 Tax=Photobacterium sp. TaxID=660 RepID=UPI00299F2007|nr:DUF3379 domain-containing protein [Photobacterium sp.]MDX1302315.1 DUF3379 domain-containing protein [Photobacterium sp.]